MIPTDLTLCLQSCGEETTGDCLMALSDNPMPGYHRLPGGDFFLDVVINVTPAVRALNQMLDQCKTRYLCPLDADMILNPDWIVRVYDKLDAVRDDADWHTIIFPLWDTLTQEKIYAFKVFNMEHVRKFPFRDDPCPDIQHYNEMLDAGLHTHDFFKEEPVGKHVVRGAFYCYAKYRDLYQVHRAHPQSQLPHHFKGGGTLKERAFRHCQFFLDQFDRTGNKDYLYCLAGMVEGITTPLNYRSKDLSDREMRVPVEEGEARFLEWHERDKSHRIFL